MGKKNEIALEMASAVFIGEVIRLNRRAFTPIKERKGATVSMRLPFMKMSFARRENLVSSSLDKIYQTATTNK